MFYKNVNEQTAFYWKINVLNPLNLSGFFGLFWVG